MDYKNKKVLFIDLDDTLIKTISGKTFPEDRCASRFFIDYVDVRDFLES